ncbi:membrane bound O-acyl transferase family-domain-containing protein [Thelephora terrestris]|uniref:Membrane bound O-acyl transferase family-domain-containing protein n=1 Tax=Thelephora terrestris TaxID=56493 RepID=A0A9P6L3M8_9AGAM|nr:membrane bound O-acyl transferase family-domain-containing protein [Thelephora terrestris]
MGRYLWAEFLLFEALRLLILYPTRHHGHRIVAFAAMICVAAQIFLTPHGASPDQITSTYLVGVMTAFRLTFTTYLLFAEGFFPNHWRRVRDGVLAEPDAAGLDNTPSSFPRSKKLWWMLDIAHSTRMIGWVQEPRNCLPAHPPPSRREFLRETTLKFIVNFAIADLSGAVSARCPTFDSRFPHNSTYALKNALAAFPILHHAPYALAFGVMTGASLNAVHNIIALAFVGIGNSSPTLWPDMYGRWGDAYTVRKLWGRTWHQHMRPMVAGLGRLVANKILKFPPGTNRSSYAQLYIAFFISAAIHFAGDFLSQQRMVYHSFKFFLLQAMAITFEDFVIYIAKQFLPQKGIKINPGKADESWAGAIVRVMGYCWVTLWFSMTLPGWRDNTSAIGAAYQDLPLTQLSLGLWKRWT